MFRFGPYVSTSSSNVSKLACSFGFSILINFTSTLFVYDGGSLVWTIFAPMSACSSQSQQYPASLLLWTLAYASIGSSVFVSVPVGVASPWSLLLPHCSRPSFLLTLVHSSATFPRCHVPALCGPFLPAPFCQPCIFSTPPHAHRRTACHSSSFSHLACRNSPDPLVVVRRRPSLRWWSPTVRWFHRISSVPSLPVLLGVHLHYFPQTGAPSLQLSMTMPWASPQILLRPSIFWVSQVWVAAL